MVNKDSSNKEKIIEQCKKINSDICILEVDDVNNSIYHLAKISRKNSIDVPIIGITGSVSKTSMSRILSNI